MGTALGGWGAPSPLCARSVGQDPISTDNSCPDPVILAQQLPGNKPPLGATEEPQEIFPSPASDGGRFLVCVLISFFLPTNGAAREALPFLTGPRGGESQPGGMRHRFSLLGDSRVGAGTPLLPLPRVPAPSSASQPLSSTAQASPIAPSPCLQGLGGPKRHLGAGAGMWLGLPASLCLQGGCSQPCQEHFAISSAWQVAPGTRAGSGVRGGWLGDGPQFRRLRSCCALWLDGKDAPSTTCNPLERNPPSLL